jgi:cytochrome c oxidase subunit III
VGVTIVFFSTLSVLAIWWLARHGLTSKPWLEQGPAGELSDPGASSVPLAKIGVGVLLASLAALFAYFISAYVLRMQMADWLRLRRCRRRHSMPLPEPA